MAHLKHLYVHLALRSFGGLMLFPLLEHISFCPEVILLGMFSTWFWAVAQ